MSKSKIDDTTIIHFLWNIITLLWKKCTFTLLCSRAFSSSCLAAAVSCWWVWRICSMADAWRWFSSERRDAERRTRDRERHREWKTGLFQGDDLLSGAELKIIHLQLSLQHKRHRWKWKWHSFFHLQFPVSAPSLCSFPVSSNYTFFQWDWAIIRAVELCWFCFRILRFYIQHLVPTLLGVQSTFINIY